MTHLVLQLRASAIVGCAVLACSVGACVAGMGQSHHPSDPDFDIQAEINHAIQNGGRTVLVPKGTYHLAPLTIDNASNFVLNGNGSTFIFDPGNVLPYVQGAVNVNYSRNVTLEDFTVDYDPLPFTQGTVTAVDYKNGTVSVQIDPGYRTDLAYFQTALSDPYGGFGVHPYIGSGHNIGYLKPNANVFYPTGVTSSGSLMTFNGLPDEQSFYNFEVGDRAAITGSRDAVGILLETSQGTKIKRVTIWTSPSVAAWDEGGGGTDAQLTVNPGPPPLGAKASRLMTSPGGYSCFSDNPGPKVHDSSFISQTDDGVNIYGAQLTVTSVTDATTVIATSLAGYDYIQTGDRLNVYDGTTFKYKGQTAVQVVILNSDGSNTFAVGSTENMSANDLLMDPDRNCEGSVIQNNYFSNDDGVGVVLQAGNSKVLNNTITDMAHAGIFLGPNEYYYYQAEFPHDVTVSGNIIYNVGIENLFRSGVYWPGNAAIELEIAPVANVADTLGTRNFTNIHINDNAIYKVPSWGIAISNASGVDLKKNIIANALYEDPLQAGAGWGVPPDSAIFVRDSDHVTFKWWNILFDPGPYETQSVVLDPTNGCCINTGGIVP